ncbi:3-oxoacyl-[acyl-carrier protein] reductase [Desulfosporosinus sp. I2]|uniref:SDR family NAD(P)-dependent oxidoreductase n=1 Tax=Desulfosporosinus sp. I2 TaxID=1617025 RepID=UPI00061EC76D|nr:SDR family NAD(P)-dependent oxidoreductase [Desulfosporosinus sp. I2]KJR47154.1 3-oxoacyl-[acyl-carrier protein] reductase [Desulfosporosinus sp. I2]
MDFVGKVCIVTGAAHGFGRAICSELARRGAQVYGWDVIANELEETKVLGQKVADKGGQVQVRVVDITAEEQVQTATQEVFQGEGRLDVLINNAGGSSGR